MPRKRKVATIVEDPISPPPTPLRAVPRKQQPNGKAKAAPTAANKSQKKNTTLKSQPAMTAIQERPAKRNPMFAIFEKAQQNESLHGKYIKELIHMCNNVSIGPSSIFILICAFFVCALAKPYRTSNITFVQHFRWKSPLLWTLFCVAYAFGCVSMKQIHSPMLASILWPNS